MSNFRFINKKVEISKILQQVLDNPDDWNEASKMPDIAGKKKPYGFLPLAMAVVETFQENLDQEELKTLCTHTELLEKTPMYYKYTEIRKFLKKYNCHNHSRAAFFRLKPGQSVQNHIDIGDYYKTRDRYHLSLQGRYSYTVEGEKHIIKPGTFFWFDNKKYHEAENISDVDRLTFVFDLPFGKRNP